MRAQVGPWLWARRSPPGEAFRPRAIFRADSESSLGRARPAAPAAGIGRSRNGPRPQCQSSLQSRGNMSESDAGRVGGRFTTLRRWERLGAGRGLQIGYGRGREPLAAACLTQAASGPARCPAMAHWPGWERGRGPSLPICDGDCGRGCREGGHLARRLAGIRLRVRAGKRQPKERRSTKTLWDRHLSRPLAAAPPTPPPPPPPLPPPLPPRSPPVRRAPREHLSGKRVPPLPSSPGPLARCRRMAGQLPSLGRKSVTAKQSVPGRLRNGACRRGHGEAFLLMNK